MRFHAQPRRLLVLASLLALSGCTTPGPAPAPKTEPHAAVKAQPPVATVQPLPTAPAATPAPPPSPAPLVLTDGPWTDCTSEEATVAVVVTVRTGGLFRDRTGAHFLRPARSTIYRLVQLRPGSPATLAEKVIPEACSTSFHLTPIPSDPAAPAISIHSTLKQIPVDPSRAITLHLRVTNGSDLFDETLVLNHTHLTERSHGTIAARIEIATPATALEELVRAGDFPAVAAAPILSDWDLLHKKFQLTGEESRLPGWFQLTRNASLQFPDIRISSEQIQIDDSHALLKLRGPVHIAWDGRSYTAGDATVRILADTVQLEAASIQPD